MSFFALLHQIQLLIFEFPDGFAAHLNFVGEGFVFLILLGLVLLERVLLDQLLFCRYFQLQFLPVGFQMQYVLSRPFCLGPGGSRCADQGLSLRANRGQFGFELLDAPVAVLKDQEFLNDVEHRILSGRKGIRVSAGASTALPAAGNAPVFSSGEFVALFEGMNFQKKAALVGIGLAWAAAGTVIAADRAVSEAMEHARQLNQAFIEVAEKASASVVVVNVTQKVELGGRQLNEGSPLWEWLPREFRRQFEERSPEEQPRTPRRHPPVRGQGSGVVIREDGYILTNSHVVENAEKIRVRFKNGKEYDAEVRGVDAQSDLAVLKINGSGFPTSSFADSDRVRVGEFAIAIGAPSDLDYTVTIGHVSAKGRSQIVPDQSMDQDFIQTDASINPGNSGGPLVNLDGEIIGINTMIRGLNTGIGFAIPSNLARQVSDKLIADGKYTRAWLGLEIRALTEDEDLRDSVTSVEQGVVVRGIRKDGPAAKSDLRLGDVITAVEGRKVTNANELRQAVRSHPVGAQITLDVVRNNKPVQVKVKTAEWPEELQVSAGRQTEAPRGPVAEEAKELGLTVKVASRDLAREFKVEFAEGLMVTKVEPDSLAAAKGVEAGDIISEVNHASVSSLREFRAAVRGADLKKGVLLTLVREGVTRLVVLKEAVE